MEQQVKSQQQVTLTQVRQCCNLSRLALLFWVSLAFHEVKGCTESQSDTVFFPFGSRRSPSDKDHLHKQQKERRKVKLKLLRKSVSATKPLPLCVV